MDFVATRFLRLELLESFKSQLDVSGFVLDMVQAPFAPNLGTVDADLTLANFVGYAFAPSDPAPNNFYEDELRSAFVFQMNLFPSSGQTEIAGAIVAPQTMWGYCCHDGLTTSLLATALFPTPVPITQQGSGATFPLELFVFSETYMV